MGFESLYFKFKIRKDCQNADDREGFVKNNTGHSESCA